MNRNAARRVGEHVVGDFSAGDGVVGRRGARSAANPSCHTDAFAVVGEHIALDRGCVNQAAIRARAVIVQADPDEITGEHVLGDLCPQNLVGALMVSELDRRRSNRGHFRERIAVNDHVFDDVLISSPFQIDALECSDEGIVVQHHIADGRMAGAGGSDQNAKTVIAGDGFSDVSEGVSGQSNVRHGSRG